MLLQKVNKSKKDEELMERYEYLIVSSFPYRFGPTESQSTSDVDESKQARFGESSTIQSGKSQSSAYCEPLPMSREEAKRSRFANEANGIRDEPKSSKRLRDSKQKPKGKARDPEAAQHRKAPEPLSKQFGLPNEAVTRVVAVAWCKWRSGKKQRKIYRYTSSSTDVVKYEIGRPTTLTENEVESLPQVSCTVESILDVRNEMGRRQ
jgi:hypothetical protein